MHQFGKDHKDCYVIDLVKGEKNRNSQTLVVELKLDITSMEGNIIWQYLSK